MKTLPVWFKKDIPDMNFIKERLSLTRDLSLHTVCESAHCPNMGECFSKGAVTFLILGNICSRNCRFCAVEKGIPKDLAIDEPHNIAFAVKKLNLDYVVVTSVTRDDLSDGGASVFADTVSCIKKLEPEAKVELLIPDFQGKEESLKIVVNSKPDVIGHNIETVKRLYPKVRPMANYEQSLNVLKKIKKINNKILTHSATPTVPSGSLSVSTLSMPQMNQINIENKPRDLPSGYTNVLTKSAILLGMGETWQEIIQTMHDLKSAACDILTIGQYLAPSRYHFKVARYISPDEFQEYQDIAKNLGFRFVLSGPFVRSSYHASGLVTLLT